MAAQRELELLSIGTSYTPQHFKDILVLDYTKQFISKYQKKDKRMLLSATNKFKQYANKNEYTLSDLNFKVMDGFKNFLISDDSLSGETPHNYFTRFKKILRGALREDLIKSMPTENIRFSNPNKDDTLKKEVLNVEELKLLFRTHCGNAAVKSAFLFCCYTGMGLAEIKKMRWSHIKKDRLIIRREKTGSLINNKLNSTAAQLIGSRKGEDDLIFDITISNVAIKKNLKNWMFKAKIEKNITFYCARHSFATLLLFNGANLKSVADAMGHASIKTTLKYLNYVEKLKDDSIDNIPTLL
ncbi:site-specific recombinase XerD [Nonlabens xylanidelens]|uniref:Site-specific recombinase XerD n=2 Tax=Nonlabens xylanidelens TaxID=191564 RepID=A0A2S6IFR3_9FLAO|nr:site-specific recombinase XerD [Nonlabens xylanidelens]PQJ18741.1 hypothetical protein BST94_06905 [Nonlabens xylanidelens]